MLTLNAGTKIFQAAKKRLPADNDIDLLIIRLFAFPENQWFSPTNKQNEEYTICKVLADAGLIVAKQVPDWSSASFHGFKISFLYNKDLIYL